MGQPARGSHNPSTASDDCLSCCHCSRERSLQQVGAGKGDYEIETKYVYVGSGKGAYQPRPGDSPPRLQHTPYFCLHMLGFSCIGGLLGLVVWFVLNSMWGTRHGDATAQV